MKFKTIFIVATIIATILFLGCGVVHEGPETSAMVVEQTI